MKRKTRQITQKIIITIILVAGAVVMLVPFLWMISTSFKELSDVFKYPPSFFGTRLAWENYVNVFTKVPFVQMFINTAIVTIVVCTGQVITSAMAGFAFSYLRYKGRDIIFKIFLFAIMIPFHVMLIPTFVLMKNLGLLNTLWSLILPCIISPLSIFMMRQNFMGMPRALGEAAAIDGASQWKILWVVYFPLSKPMVATLAIFSFTQSWNDFIRPLIFLSSNKNVTLTLGLYNMIGSYGTDWGLLMAAVVLSILPILILYLCLQDYFVEGIAMTGLKG